MKDRFKFRAWDKRTDSYYNPLDKDINGLTLAIRDNVANFDMFAYDLELSSIVMEQCTGLKDVNGKLIYEGDILRSTDGFFHQKYKVKLGYMMNGLTNDVENILMFSDDGFVELSIKTNDQDMINILNQARSMLDDFNS